MSSATVGLLTSYADKSRWTPTQASRDANRKALQDSSWADVSRLPFSLRTQLTYATGASRYCSCVRYVQPHDSRFRPLHSETC